MNFSVKKIDFETQKAILQTSIENDIALPKLLKELKITYDSFRYENDLKIDENAFEKIECLEDAESFNENIPAVSFFSGAGGFDIGFNYAGFNTLASIEINEIFCDTLRKNNPKNFVIGPPNYSGDVSNREELAEILRKNGIKSNFDGVFYGGPPCQSFSIAANQRFSKSDKNFKRTGFEDAERGNLIFDYLWFIKTFRPRAFLIENVPGIMQCDTSDLLKKSFEDLKKIGYLLTEPQIINATYYGVPQKRLRWIFAGTLEKKEIIFPKPAEKTVACGEVFFRDLENIPNHITREHTSQSVLRYMILKYGERDKLGRVDRLDPRLPSKTVIAGGTKGGGRSHLHPFIPRTLSVRECARLQTFPDNYVFTGSNARQFTQVGNAVPPLLAYKLANSIKQSII